jgi:hypothetical protein
VASCGSDPTGDVFTVSGVVRGQVTNIDGQPIPDAWVALDGRYPSGNGNTIPVFDSTLTDSAGRYLGTLAVLNMPDTLISFDVRIWPPASSGLIPAGIGDLGLRLTQEASDTFNLDFQLSP